MAGQKQALTQLDFSSGENLVANPFDLPKNQVQSLSNLILDEHGSVRCRDGTLIQNTASPDATRPIVKIYDLILNNGTVKKLAILLGAATNDLYDRSTTPWTNLGTFVSAYTLPDILMFVNEAVIAAGNTEPLKYYDGTTFGALAGAPNAAHAALHLGYLWAWNTNPSTTASAGPSSLQSSDVNNPGSWPAPSQLFISKDDGQSGQGLGLFTIAETGISPTAALIAFKDFSTYEVSGVFGASNFAVQKTKSDMGCIAPRTIQFVSGFGIIRLTHRGFALFDGVNDVLISEEERPRIFGRDATVGLDWTNISRSYAVQVPNPPMYICACPVAGTTLTRVFVYDLVRKAWSVCSFANSLSTLQLSLVPGVLPVVLGGDAVGGFVRRYFAGDTTDDGTIITWTMRTRPALAESPLRRAYFEALAVETFNMTVGTTVSVTFYYGPNAVTVSKTVVAITSVLNTTGYGTQPYGVAPYGDAASVTLYDETLFFYILGGVISNSMFADISGTGPGKIRGLEWQIKSKPMTRATTSVLQA